MSNPRKDVRFLWMGNRTYHPQINGEIFGKIYWRDQHEVGVVLDDNEEEIFYSLKEAKDYVREYAKRNKVK
jgi:hypothetical protein